MRFLRRWRSMGVVALLAGLATPMASAGPVDPPPVPVGGDRSSVVTLITGDVVRLDTSAGGSQRATVVSQADPRGGIHSFRSGGDVYVEPGSVSALLARGDLDEQLFNVSSLVRQGYSDERRDSLPLIVSYQGVTGLAANAAPAGSRVSGVLHSANAMAVSESKRQAARFWTDVAAGSPDATPVLRRDIAKIWLDEQVHATLDKSVPQIGGRPPGHAASTARASRSRYSTAASTQLIPTSPGASARAWTSPEAATRSTSPVTAPTSHRSRRAPALRPAAATGASRLRLTW